MLHVYCGNDVIGVRAAAFDLVSELEEQGVRVNRIDIENYQTGAVADGLGAQSLFGGQELYVLDTPSSDEGFASEMNDNLKEMAESPNTFVVIEGALLAPEKKKFQKHAETFKELKVTAGERFNAFGMADALARKDKKSLWLLLQQGKRAGLSDEEIMGTLWWQLKSLRLAAQTKTASEAGMKDFPYNKAKRALTKFKDGEVESLSHSLLSVYHQGHAGLIDTDLALEQWVLTV